MKQIELLFVENGRSGCVTHGNITELMASSYKGDMEKVCECIKKGHLIDQKSDKDATALIFASYSGHSEIAKMLLENNAAPNSDAYYVEACWEAWDFFSQKGLTALMCAAYGGHLEIAKVLIDKGALVNKKIDYAKWAALHFAACSGATEIAKLLLANGAIVDSPDEVKMTPLMISAQNGNTGCMKILLDYSADIDKKDRWGNSALIFAALGGHFHTVKALLENGADCSAFRNGELRWDSNSIAYGANSIPFEIRNLIRTWRKLK